MNEEVVETVSTNVKRAYVQLRRLYGHPKYYPNMDRWGKYFDKAARLMLKEKIDNPLRYVEAQFAALRPHTFPQPNMLVGKNALERYRTFMKSGDDEDSGRDTAAARFRFEVDYLTTRLRVGYTLRSVMTAKHSPLSALFRYVICDRKGLTEEAEMHAQLARAQLELDEDNYEVYGDLLPDGMRRM